MAVAAGLVAGVACALRLGMVFTRGFDPDEFQHLHGGWSLAHGLWPYRDYFEHHTPWLHLALAPFFSLFDVDHDPDDAVAFVFLARGAMWVLATAALALTYRIARLWAGTRTGCVAAALLSVTVAFFDKGVEIRPDVPALVCLLGSWVATVAALRRDPATSSARWRLLAGGVLLGAALLFTQKALFTVPATGVLFLWWAADRRQVGSVRARVIGVLVFAAGVLVPIAATLVLFAPHTGVGAFIHSNLILNAGWKVRFSPLPMMRRILGQNPILLAVALVGLVRSGLRLKRAEALARGDALLVLQAAGVIIGAFVIPTPQLQYFMMVLPLVAMLAARTLVDAGEAAARAVGRGASRQARAGIVMAGLAVIAARPMAIMAGELHPPRPKAQDQLGRMRLVLASTTPDETVMDGFTGAGVFRPHAYYYFFLFDEIRALLGAPEIGRLRGELRDGEIAPALVLYDADLRDLPREITTFLEENYQPAGDPLVWRPRHPPLDGEGQDGRLDLGQGPTDTLVGRGWSDSKQEDGRSVRRTQGQRSMVRVPLRRPGDLLLAVHARPDGAPGSQRLGLVVNDTGCGEQTVATGWRDYVFRVPALAWRAGINRVRLTHAGAEDGDRPRPVPLIVDYLQLRPPPPTRRTPASY